MATRAGFPAGRALESHKATVAGMPILVAPAPARLVLALDQGSGYAAQPVVTPGDRVACGTLLARAVDPRASALHAPLAGRVSAIASCAAAVDGGIGTCIVLEPDGSATVDPALRPTPDWQRLPPAELVDRLRDAGIAGLGGAAFPTATKLAAGRARGARQLLLNGAECEPWICCDDALMRARAAEVVLGARILQHALEADGCNIAVEDDKPAAIAALRSALDPQRTGDPAVVVVPAIYPQGAERQLITAVTGIEVPAGRWPVDAGVVCQNVATAAAVARWASTGLPATDRVVTVTGSGVARPCNVEAPFGTPLAALVQAAGGYRGTPLRLVAGGNMTGRALASDEVGLAKAINCVFVATQADLRTRLEARELPCIRCGDCATVCPPGLLPQQLHRAAGADDFAALRSLGLRDCIDCGLCDYVCPSQIPLAQRFRAARQRLAATDLAAQRAAAARERFVQHERRLRESAEHEQRTLAEVRRRARETTGGDADGND